MKNMNVVNLEKVSKIYFLYGEKPTLSERFIKNEVKTIKVIDNLTLRVEKGQKLGILGLNGSGKTTLLKLITGIANPTSGKVGVVGRMVSLIDLEAGFEEEMTGRQNIFLNGLLIGMRRHEVESKLASIIYFSGLGDFIDQPLHIYSTGMRLRLGFSVAAFSQPEILVLDEVIAVGDIGFQVKVRSKINELFEAGRTVIIASHWLEFVEQMCTRVVVLKDGKIVKEGGKEVVEWFRLNNK